MKNLSYPRRIHLRLEELQNERQSAELRLQKIINEESELRVTLDVLNRFQSDPENDSSDGPQLTIAEHIVSLLTNKDAPQTIREIMECLPENIQQKSASATLSILKKQKRVINDAGRWSLVEQNKSILGENVLLSITNNNNGKGAIDVPNV